jgi:quercetin dioxygenase-like cupin family protein
MSIAGTRSRARPGEFCFHGGMTILEGTPQAIHRGEQELPFVDLGDGSTLQLLQVDLDAGLWVIRNRFKPGMRVQRHRHTGPVFAFTQSGSWKYEEYPEINRAGSYLYEPAGSIHTLIVPEDNTEDTDVWFSIYGANLNLDADGNVEMVIDAGTVLEFYLAMCEADGHPRPNVIGT